MQEMCCQKQTLLFILLALLPCIVVGPARAQLSTDKITADPIGTYFILKGLIKSNYPIDAADKFGDNSEQSEYLMLESCSFQEQNFPIRGPLRETLVNLAFRVLEAEYVLEKYKYPEDLWRKELASQETRALNFIKSRVPLGRGPFIVEKYEVYMGLNLHELTQKANAEAKRRDLKVQSLTTGVGCGGPPAYMEVRTKPRGGQAHLIPKLMYLYCERTGIDPNDQKKCDHWFEVRDGSSTYLGGFYKYVIKWNDKSSGIKDVNADAVERFIEETQKFMVVLDGS